MIHFLLLKVPFTIAFVGFRFIFTFPRLITTGIMTYTFAWRMVLFAKSHPYISMARCNMVQMYFWTSVQMKSTLYHILINSIIVTKIYWWWLSLGQYMFYEMTIPLPWASVHWLVQCTLECHWNATGWPSVHWDTTGPPSEYLQGTPEHHWKNLVETAPHWNTTGET